MTTMTDEDSHSPRMEDVKPVLSSPSKPRFDRHDRSPTTTTSSTASSVPPPQTQLGITPSSSQQKEPHPKQSQLHHQASTKPSKPKQSQSQSSFSTSVVRRGCAHQPTRLWSEENDLMIRNMITALKLLESAQSADFNLITFCLSCRSGTTPRVICLGCGAVHCYSNPDLQLDCFQASHSSKPLKCRLGLDLICRELICMVCGDIVEPDEQESKLLSRRLFPPVKRSFAPGCLARTTSSIFPPKGFRNLGNSCYMNVILQIILRIPELQSYLLTDHHNRLKHRTIDEVYCCACELIEILQSNSGVNLNYLNPPNKDRSRVHDSISPVGFLYSLWMNSGDGEDFAGYRESDAHECLLACLNQLHTATQVLTNNNSTGSTSTNLMTAAATTTSTTDPTNCQCPVHLLFRCELSSHVVCGNCHKSSHKSDPILDISLEIGHLNHLQTLRLEDCLDSFTKCERLKEKCYRCTECEVASPETTKSLKISQLPHILCIQLKRFEQHGSSSVKLDKHVKFPLILNMKPYCTTHHRTPNDDDDDTNYSNDSSDGFYYKLTGIVRHQGNVSSGHYQAIIYQDDQYFCFNDGLVNILRLKEVLEVEAYILVYSFLHP